MAIAGKCHHTQEPFQRLRPLLRLMALPEAGTREKPNKYGKANAYSYSTLTVVHSDYEYGLCNDKNSVLKNHLTVV